MSFSAQECFDYAQQCERMASQEKDPGAKAAFVECVRDWLELARQMDTFERARPKRL
jgi:hypothetical protein